MNVKEAKLLNRYYLIVSGIVQGVGFRYFVQKTAVELELTGYVRNCYNETVEIEVQGKDEIILKFLKIIRSGNGHSEVDDICSKKINIKESEKKFNITF